MKLSCMKLSCVQEFIRPRQVSATPGLTYTECVLQHN